MIWIIVIVIAATIFFAGIIIVIAHFLILLINIERAPLKISVVQRCGYCVVDCCQSNAVMRMCDKAF